MTVGSETVERYRELLAAEPSLAVALCWTGLRGTRPLDDVTWRLGDVTEVVESASIDEVLARQDAIYAAESSRLDLVWVIETEDGTGLLEPNGFAGSNPEVLRALSWNRPPVASMYWNVNVINRLSVAAVGEVESVDVFAGFADEWDSAPTLTPYRHLFVGGEDSAALGTSLAGGLAVVEDVTGVALRGEHLRGVWPMVVFRARTVQVERLGTTLGQRDPELGFALDAAEAEVRWAASVDLAGAAVDASAARESAAVLGVVRDMVDGPVADADVRLRDLVQRYYREAETASPTEIVALRRDPVLLAARTLVELNMPYPNGSDSGGRHNGWGMLAALYGDDWPTTRDTLLTRLRSTPEH